MTAAERFVKRMLGGVFGDKPSEVVEKRGLGDENGDKEWRESALEVALNYLNDAKNDEIKPNVFSKGWAVKKGKESGEKKQKKGKTEGRKVDEKPKKTAQDSLYEALVADESPKDKTLAEHDKERHPNGFNPETDSCKFREELKKETETDKGDEVDVDRGREEGIEVDGEGNGNKPLVSAEEDAEYLEAVKKGDMETAAKMVREVAARAFPNTKVVDKDGKPKIVYHGGNFRKYDTVPDLKPGEMHFGTLQSAKERVAYKYQGMEDSVSIDGYFLNLENPKRMDDIGGDSIWLDYGNPEDRKHDGVVYKNESEDKGEDSYAVSWEPSRIKSADPVTYDDDGNVIPLSRRFDDGDDIRGGVSVKGVSLEETAKKEVPDSEKEKPADTSKVYEGLSKKKAEEYRSRMAKKRPDLDADLILTELGKIKDKKIQGDAFAWVMKGAVRLPEDLYKVEQARELATKAKRDPMQWDTPQACINELTRHGHKISEKPITVEELKKNPLMSDYRDEGYGVETFQVDDSRDGQQLMRQVIDTHWGKDANPWCLLARHGEPKLEQTEEAKSWIDQNYDSLYDELGLGNERVKNHQKILESEYEKRTGKKARELVDRTLDDAWGYWNKYNALPKRVAFKDGKLLAFMGTDTNDDYEPQEQWWDNQDRPHRGIPLEDKITVTDGINKGRKGIETVLYKGQALIDPEKGFFEGDFMKPGYRGYNQFGDLETIITPKGTVLRYGICASLDREIREIETQSEHYKFDEFGSIISYRDKKRGIELVPSRDKDSPIGHIEISKDGIEFHISPTGEISKLENGRYHNVGTVFFNKKTGEIIRKGIDDDGLTFETKIPDTLKYDDLSYSMKKNLELGQIRKKDIIENDFGGEVLSKFKEDENAKTTQDELVSALMGDVVVEDAALPNDKTLQEHDKERHKGHFDPSTQTCKFREQMMVETESDKADLVDSDVSGKGQETDSENGNQPLVTPEEDKEYMEAVERDDMETASRMLREVAARAFPNTKVVDEDGLPKIVFHNSDSSFTVPSVPWEGPIEWEGLPGLFFADREQPQYGRNKISCFVNLMNPLDMNDGDRNFLHGRSSNQIDAFTKQYEDAIKAGEKEFEFRDDGVLKITPKGMSLLKNDGYFGEHPEDEIGKVVEYAVMSGRQVKSADPVTYDDDGNVIPLSRRFDDGDDIRGDLFGGTSSSVRRSISDDGEEFGDSFYGEVYPDRKQSYSSEFGKDYAEDGEKASEAYRENFTKDGKYKSPFEGGKFNRAFLERAIEGKGAETGEVWDDESRAAAEAAGRVLSGILGGVSFMLAEKPYSGREEVDTRFNPENHDIRFKNPAGKVVGEYNRSTNQITLYPGAKIKDVVHEYSHGLWQFAEQEAKAGRDGLQKKLHQIAHAAPEKVKEAVGRSYYDQDPNVVLEECFTHEMARRSEKNKAFADAIKTASGKKWYEKAWGAIKDTWKGLASKLGFNKADTSRIDDMTSGEAADYILTQMAQGKKFGNVSGEGDSSTETRMAKESSNSDTYVLPSGRKIPSAQKYLHTDAKGNPHDEMWSVFLEKQTGDGRVSQEFSDVVEGLFSGKDIDADTIKSLPEWKKAMEREKEIQKKLQETHGIDSTVEIQTEERERFRDAIIRAAMSDHISKTVPIEGTDSEFETNEGLKEGESYDVEKGRNICIVIGLPAAGKSTSFANPLAKKFKARLCDSDTIKKVLPEFNNGYGGNLVHEESTMLNEEILNRSIEQGDNIVYPILGYKPEKLEKMFKMLRDKGYKINLCLKDMPANIAKGRLLGRFLSKGRYLPIECITKAQGKFADCFERVKGLVDAYVRATSDIDGSNERIIEKKGDLI